MGIVVLVGIDGSDAGRRAVAFARDRAKALNGEVVLAHIIPWSPYSFTTPEENEERPKRRAAELAAADEQVMRPALEIIGDEVKCTPIVKHGDRVELLIQLAREHNVNHILVGRTGESRLRNAFFGNVPAHLIQMADVPVTVVP